jgi:IMP dehydrogenase/GMP reductase
MKLDFNDLLIVPKELTDINTRTAINPFYNKGFLPLITAPMDTVVNSFNAVHFYKRKINICTPRGEDTILGFKSYSYFQIKEMLDNGKLYERGSYLIDVANGHMDNILKVTKQIKEKYPTLQLMVGNIANPKAYTLLSEAGADYIRVGIGNGGGCLTTQNTGVGYPMASLIKECYEESLKLDNPAKIVADGGMKDYSDVIKALGLGADYVMLGSILNKAFESAGDMYLWKKIKVNSEIAEIAYKIGIPVYKKFRGMSTKEVQKKWGAKKTKTSEGVVRFRKVEYRLEKWVENFEDYLRSAMSYAGAHNLEEFIGRAEFVQISNNAYKRFNK